MKSIKVEKIDCSIYFKLQEKGKSRPGIKGEKFQKIDLPHQKMT